MNSGLKQRLVGAIVLIAIGVIFVPGVLRERQVEPVSTKTLIPDRPPQETMTFDAPSAPTGIEAAPPPETMFIPDDARPAPELAEAPPSNAARASEPESEPEPLAEAEAVEPPDEEPAVNEAAWVLQVGSFRSADSARNLRDRLQAEGYRAYMRSASTPAGEVSRVYIGPKVDRAEAEKAKAAIDASLEVDALVLRFEP